MWNIIYQGIAESFRDIDDFSVLTQEPPWSTISDVFPHNPRKSILVENLDLVTLERYLSDTRDVGCVVGLGGGTAIDAAKYIALKTGKRLICVPSVMSVNAFLSWKVATRSEGIVTYIGDIYSNLVVIDFDLIKGAPKRLNRAGVGDIYSARTSLIDWKMAHDRSGEFLDEDTYERSQNVVKTIVSNAKEIHDVTDSGIKTLVWADSELLTLVKPSVERGRTWPTDGCEHIFFYSLENITRKSYIHGEIVGMGSIVGTYIQQEDVSSVIKDLDAFGLQFRPADNSISFETFEKAIYNMKHISDEMNFHYVALDEHIFIQEEVRELWRLLS